MSSLLAETDADVIPEAESAPALLIDTTWRPLVELTRLRHQRFRKELAATETLARPGVNVLTPGV